MDRLLWPLVACMHAPNVAYVALAVWQPPGLWWPGVAIAVEQFGYGLGFTAYMVYMLMVTGEGAYKAAHYAICTGFMALGMMLPGLGAGWLQERLGYPLFFGLVCLATLLSMAATLTVRITPGFGRAAVGPLTSRRNRLSSRLTPPTAVAGCPARDCRDSLQSAVLGKGLEVSMP